MRQTSLIFFVASVQGIRLKPAATTIEHCVREPRGDWRTCDADILVKEYLKNRDKFPELCSSVSPGKDFDAASCNKAEFGKTFVSDCLEAFDAEAFVNSIANKTLSLIGDSMMAQLFERISCSMVPVSHMVSNVLRKYGNPAVPDWGFFRLDFKNGAVVQYQYIDRSLKWLKKYKGPTKIWRFNRTVFDADVFLVNIGAWQKRWPQLESELGEIRNAISKHHRPGARFIFREYYPTHFPSNSAKGYDFARKGMKALNHSERSCEPRDISFNEKRLDFPESFNRSLDVERMRLNTATKFMEDKGWEVLRAFDMATPSWDMHPGESVGKRYVDCRHWCQPSPVLDATKMVLANMLEETSL